MVPSIRNILGGFLFSGDDVDKPVRVLSGGERTRLAVARMLLRPSNTLLLDEPTNHLDLDSKDVLLEALEDFGGTLIFVSHDRYFVDKLATKVIEIGGGEALVYPGTYEEFLWSRQQREAAQPLRQPAAAKPVAGASPPAARRRRRPARRAAARSPGPRRRTPGRAAGPAPQAKASAQQSYEERSARGRGPARIKKAADTLRKRIDELEARIAEREQAIKELEATMSAPGFYDNHETAKPVIDRHQALMWEVGDLMSQWEALQQTQIVIDPRICNQLARRCRRSPQNPTNNSSSSRFRSAACAPTGLPQGRQHVQRSGMTPSRDLQGCKLKMGKSLAAQSEAITISCPEPTPVRRPPVLTSKSPGPRVARQVPCRRGAAAPLPARPDAPADTVTPEGSTAIWCGTCGTASSR